LFFIFPYLQLYSEQIC